MSEWSMREVKKLDLLWVQYTYPCGHTAGGQQKAATWTGEDPDRYKTCPTCRNIKSFWDGVIEECSAEEEEQEEER